MSFLKRGLYVLCLIQLLACENKPVMVSSPAILPIPANQVINEGVFILDETISVTYDNDLEPAANLLQTFIEKGLGKHIKNENSNGKVIAFHLDESISHSEGYRLSVTEKRINIASQSVKGAFWGVQSLRQLLPACFENNSCGEVAIAVQNLEIEDAPQFKYRGMHLDVGRHMFPVDFIKKYIDMIALVKMNTFHWHLTEDQGWRIEIKKYPKLTSHAAYRKETLIGHGGKQPFEFDGKPYGGFYTQEEIKEVVKYATERGVTIIPEIELPGHSQAAISAYPELGCTGKDVEVATRWGVFHEVYCPSETTFKFLEDVFDEVMDLFPSEYIHIGGDEAPKTRWEESQYCQDLIKKEGLKDEHELQSYFISRIEKYLNSKGRQIIGWDEILEGGLAPNATVMSWRGVKGAIDAVKQQHDVILTPGSHCYFDHYQANPETEPLAIGGYLPLEKVYNFNPIPEALNEEETQYVLGAQGNVWTEYMKTSDHVEYMAFPRAMALSEVVWSRNEHKNYDDFIERLEILKKRMDKLEVNYSKHTNRIGPLPNKQQ